MRRIYVRDGASFVWQWQPKEHIILEDYPDGVFVRYSNCDTVKAPVVQTRRDGDKLIADIPPELMQVDKDITVYVCNEDGIVHCHFLSVINSPKPSSYVYEPVEVLRYESLAERIRLIEEWIANGGVPGGGIQEETDPTVPAWAKEPQKPPYTAQEVGALPEDTKIPGKTSELTNDSGFITKSVADLVNYYTKTQTEDLIAQIPKFRISVVQQLPAAGEELVLYLVPFATAEGQYLEYIWTGGRFEVIGSQKVDLTGYATEEWVQAGYQPKGDYLLATALPGAIEDALEQAKAGGLFDGADGRGIKSIARTAGNGAAGTVDVYTITYTDGTTSTFQVRNGANGKDGQNADLTGYAKEYTVWENIQIAEINGAILTTSRYVSNQATGKYAEVFVGGYTQLRVTGYQYDASYGYALCAFFDEQQKLISAVTLINKTQYTDYLVDVPADASTVAVNGKIGNNMALAGLKVFNCKTLAEEKANRIARWVMADGAIKSGYVIAADGLGERQQADGQIATFDVGKWRKVRVTGYQWALEYGFDLCCFYDDSGSLISSHSGTASSKPTTITLDVPENAATLKVNGKAHNTIEVSAYQIFDVEDLYEAFRPTGKKLIALGDSITALGTGNTGWLKYFVEKTGCELIANVATNSAVLRDNANTVYDGNPQQSNQANNVLGNQVQKIINNGYEAPDIIMIAIGTNGGIAINKEQIRAAYYDDSNALIPRENVDRTTDAGAYRWCLETLHAAYPAATVFWCTPIMGYQGTRSADNAVNYAESLRIATEYTGQILIDTIRCGINGVNEVSGANGEFLVDGLHPNANGAKRIGYYNASKVLPYLGNLC